MTEPGPSTLPRRPLLPSKAEEHSVFSSNSCSVCSKPSKYTCPRCSIKTCSLVCSKSHKASSGCTGERDRSAYVSMNSYTCGTLADDYVFLEDIGRNITSWGRDIVSSGRGRGQRGGKGKSFLTPRCENLRVQLAARDIGISFLAEGMEKRKLNQSVWDVRTKTAYLTVEFIFHISDCTQNSDKLSAVSLLTHRNDLAISLAKSLSSHLKRKSDVPTAISEFMQASEGNFCIPPDTLFAISQVERLKPGEATADQYQAPTLPIRVASHHPVAPSQSYNPLKPRKVFYPFDPQNSLRDCLRHRSFVEWPTIDIFLSQRSFEAGRFGVLAKGATIPSVRPEGPNKRRKTETGLVQLLGGYGDESESENESPMPQETASGINGLGGYASGEGEEADEVEAGLQGYSDTEGS